MRHVETARALAQDLFGRDAAGSSDDHFSDSVWERLGEAGLLGLSVPKAFGGVGLDSPSLFRVGEALVDGGCSLGLALSWLIHNLTARHVLADYCGDDLRSRYLSAIAQGDSSLAIAVSEPDMHGSPKKLEAQAVQVDGGYRLSGEKVYLTNGPIADLFAFVAIVGQEGNRKKFAAFLVGKDQEGVSVETMDIGSLKPSPHARLVLKDCWVPKENRMTIEGDAFENLVKPFGFFERVLLLGPTLGAMKRFLSIIAGYLADDGRKDDEIAEQLGHLVLFCDEVDVLGGEAARIVDNEAGRLSPLPSSMSAWGACRCFVERAVVLIGQAGHGADPEINKILHDMDQLCRLAEGAQKHGFIRLGRNLIGWEGSA